MANEKETVLAIIDAMNRQDLKEIADFLHDDVTNLQIPTREEKRGKDVMLAHFPTVFAAFPDAQTRCINLHGDGPTVICEWEYSGTWTGPFGGLKPNGNAFAFRGAEFYEIIDGKIKAQRGYWDKDSWFLQLGISS